MLAFRIVPYFFTAMACNSKCPPRKSDPAPMNSRAGKSCREVALGNRIEFFEKRERPRGSKGAQAWRLVRLRSRAGQQLTVTLACTSQIGRRRTSRFSKIHPITRATSRPRDLPAENSSEAGSLLRGGHFELQAIAVKK